MYPPDPEPITGKPTVRAGLTPIERQLIRHEGIRLHPYRCSAGKLTLGVGHNLDAKPITERAALVILDDDLAEVRRDLDRELAWWRSLDEVRQRVLMDMVFQMGITGLCRFVQTIDALRGRDSELTATRMLQSLWSQQTPARAERLAEMMRSGQEGV
jgi:lysozyme